MVSNDFNDKYTGLESHDRWGWGRKKMTLWPSWFKATFNQYHSITILYNMFFDLKALKLPFSENGWLEGSVLLNLWNGLLQNLWSEPPLEWQNNLTWMIVNMLRTKTWQRSLQPSMLRLETEAGNVHIVHPYEEPEVLNELQANWRKWACRHVRNGIDIKYKHWYLYFFYLLVKNFK